MDLNKAPSTLKIPRNTSDFKNVSSICVILPVVYITRLSILVISASLDPSPQNQFVYNLIIQFSLNLFISSVDLLWTAPEILRHDIACGKRRTQKADVYSFGIILYEILGRSGPYGYIDMEPKGEVQFTTSNEF